MSFRAVEWAVRQRIPCFQKMVLIMLADRHNADTGRCDPSHELLVNDCGMSRRSVIDQLDKLQQLGLITIINRAKDGLKTSNSYKLHLAVCISSDVQEPHDDVQQMHNAKPAKTDVQQAHNDVQGLHGGSAGAAHGVVQELHINPEVEPVIEPVIAGRKRPAKRRTGYPADFYPDQTGQAKANEKGLHVPRELERFRDYHEAKGNVFADWQAAWRTWVGNARPMQAAPRQAMSFAERDAEAQITRWEEMTGEVHPSRKNIINFPGNEPRRLQ